MSSYQLNRRRRLLAKKTKLEDQIDLLETAYESAIQNAEVESYKFDSGEGSQQTKRRSLEEISKELEKLERSLSWVLNELAGIGVMNVQLRRKRGNHGTTKTTNL
jgi:uncharacterized membrane protein